MTATTFCSECHEMTRYRVEHGSGLWFCCQCGFAVECGLTMFRGHDCQALIEARQ